MNQALQISKNCRIYSKQLVKILSRLPSTKSNYLEEAGLENLKKLLVVFYRN